ncbi:uncharacterized protein BDW43DRAFT_266034 [Aspergillus alliaceus]|uniref:uncharacterized protein n=1 Tax=Petromyces alliaceus TaxID=209559 RepID=UPI0012A3D636|nr:uncharacterized protein BDW43DRAFT_266034 [Aspergillus alliaceus]KAB8236784.1 hypothetical protein BDW43DRAFT_266034 [Aspergillus alliaceus]
MVVYTIWAMGLETMGRRWFKSCHGVMSLFLLPIFWFFIVMRTKVFFSWHLLSSDSSDSSYSASVPSFSEDLKYLKY